MLPLFLLLTVLTEPPEPPDKVVIVEHGIYASADEVGGREVPETNMGYVRTVDGEVRPELLEETTRIPAKVGTRFGIHFLFDCAGPAKYPVTVRVHHPPMTNPRTGKTTTVEEWEMTGYPIIARFTGYLFEEEWEAVPGRWRIDLVVDGRVMASQKFRVVH